MKKLALVLALIVLGCQQESTKEESPAMSSQERPSAADQDFLKVHDEYVVGFLQRNPVVNTYLGGAGLDPSLKDVDGRLRDHSAQAIAEEDRWLDSILKKLEGIDAAGLSATRRIDREIALAQIRFLLRQHQTRRYQQRALDTYTDEPFRGIDWQLQGMSQTGEESYGTPEEWNLVIARLSDIPRFLSTARDQLISGVQANNTPDHRMLQRNGLNTTEANAEYFEKTLPQLADDRIAGTDRDAILQR